MNIRQVVAVDLGVNKDDERVLHLSIIVPSAYLYNSRGRHSTKPHEAGRLRE